MEEQPERPFRPLSRRLAGGRHVVGTVHTAMAGRLVDFLRRTDPGLLAGMTDVGLLRRDWVDEPGSGPMTSATPFEVLERSLARLVERRPSTLAALGLSAVEVLSASSDAERDPAASTSRLAVMFTDIEGFSRFTATEGDEAAARLLVEHYRSAGPIVRSRGGRVVKRLGDGLLMTFPEASASVLAGVELVAARPGSLRVRAGAHHGDVVVQRNDVVGHVVNVAARVTELAHAGQVLVTGDLRDAVADDLKQVEFGRPRLRRFAGVGDRVPVCSVRPRLV
ncbi:MAG TPA: adenylate/guanylate cyclase domain-containing protein [Mycobacteriales bacterium]|nr:adenylate/guanylate cyclase domain-containing protein [Mycobacteriales bacterium]